MCREDEKEETQDNKEAKEESKEKEKEAGKEQECQCVRGKDCAFPHKHNYNLLFSLTQICAGSSS